MSRNKFILSAIFLISMSLLFAGNAAHVSAEENDNTICKGVFIDEVDVSGMTREQAEAAVGDLMDNLRSRGVAIMIGEEVVYTTLGDLGYKYEPNDNIKQALALGKSGNLIKRYKDLKDIEQGSVIYPLTFTYDENKIRDVVTADVSAYNIAPIDATVSRKNGEFVYTDHIVGSKVNIEQTTQLVKNAIDHWNRQDIVLEAVIDADMPIYTKDVVENCNALLGTFTTEYADSAEGRAANLANGARLINNTVIYPGDIFSAYEHLTPFTEENGYYIAKAYLQGKVVDSVGGGACQVTTTLYNAVLKSELEVVERQPHSMTISYVDLSRDAAIAGTYKDFKFMNNTDVPILIEATTKGRTITFKIWGHEIRDTKNRKVEFVTVVLSEIPAPADVITEDPTQPTSYKKVTQSAHTGYKAELYKVVYENGVEVSRTLVNKSNYSAAPKYLTIGTKPEKKPKPDKTPGDEKEDTTPQNEDSTQPQEDTQTQEDTQSQDNAQTQNQSTLPENQTNPEGEVQADIWDPAWDEVFPTEE